MHVYVCKCARVSEGMHKSMLGGVFLVAVIKCSGKSNLGKRTSLGLQFLRDTVYHGGADKVGREA